MYMQFRLVNPLLNNKIVDWSNLKASADNKSYVTKKVKFVLERVDNIMGKGGNAGNHNVFKRLFIQGR